MITTHLDCPIIRTEHGVLLQRHRGWWLVEFPTRDYKYMTVYRLTGRMNPGLTKHTMPASDRRDFPHGCAPICPPESDWAGKFVLTPSPEANTYDLAWHSGPAKASEEQARLARVAVDSELYPIPDDFTSVLKSLPHEDVPVLAIRASGYMCATFELLTARYMPTYRPLSPWRDLSNDSVCDSGSEVLGWRPATGWIKPR